MENIDNIEELDARMHKELSEERRKQYEKRRKRRTKRLIGKIIFAVIALAIVAAVAAMLINHFSSDVYKNEEEFAAFAKESFEEEKLLPLPERTSTEFVYDEPFSYAVRYGNSINTSVDSFRNDEIRAIIQKNRKNAAAEENLDKATALLIETSEYETGNGAVSMAVHQWKYREINRELKFISSDVDTFLIDAETGALLEPLQVLNTHYRDKVSEVANSYFSKSYKKSQRVDGWDKYLTPNDDNFSKFIMTGDTFVFFFDRGTVVDRTLGITSMNVKYSAMETAIRHKVLYRYIDPSKPMVALTYDDGPGDKSEKTILNTLSKYGAVATFFYVGNRVSTFSDNARRAVKIGCEIGNHSWDHPAFTTLSKKAVISQVKRTNSEIYKTCGVKPELIRPPYGDYNKSVVKASSMANVLWTLDTLDWQSRNPKKIIRSVTKKKKLDGRIILMHSIYDETATATKYLVPWLKKHGYQTVTVSELIKYKTGSAPKEGKLYRKMQ